MIFPNIHELYDQILLINECVRGFVISGKRIGNVT